MWPKNELLFGSVAHLLNSRGVMLSRLQLGRDYSLYNAV